MVSFPVFMLQIIGVAFVAGLAAIALSALYRFFK